LGLLGDAGLTKKLEALIVCFYKKQSENSDLQQEDDNNESDTQSIMTETLSVSDNEDDSDN
jgi:hypothetical protein